MKPVEQAVSDGSHHDPDDDEKNNPGIERIGRGEDLARGRADGMDGAHASEDHGRIKEGVEQGQALEDMVPGDPKTEGEGDDAEADQDVIQEASKEFLKGQQRLGSVFIHAGYCSTAQGQAGARFDRFPAI
jgi:hypothetical protein